MRYRLDISHSQPSINRVWPDPLCGERQFQRGELWTLRYEAGPRILWCNESRTIWGLHKSVC